jgi:chromosome segregation protein
VIREIDDQIVEVFGQAFEAVATEFEGVFGRLFPGGSGKLKLTDPDDLLTSGIEVEARPPGKNIRKLSLLSGGERSLVALAFLLSIFRSRPSPFYLLDEVEAALDDINLQRFLTLIHELEQNAQVLIVTHQKRTMEAADVLYGVSMAKDGVSSVVARRMEESPQPV